MRILILSVLIWTGVHGAANAQGLPTACRLHASYPGHAMKVCTRVILSDRTPKKVLAQAHLHRGLTFAHPYYNEFRLAIVDFDRAIALGADAYLQRARSRLALTILDLHRAARAKPKNKQIQNLIKYLSKEAPTILPHKNRWK
jgi:hypothetical protein